jgi:hypothetical protein
MKINQPSDTRVGDTSQTGLARAPRRFGAIIFLLRLVPVISLTINALIPDRSRFRIFANYSITLWYMLGDGHRENV